MLTSFVSGLQIAKRQAVVNPENTFFSVKRFIGRKMTEVKEEAKQVPYVVCMCTLCGLQSILLNTPVNDVSLSIMSELFLRLSIVPLQVVEDNNGNVKIKCPNAGKEFAAEEISSQVLRKLTGDAAKFLNDKVSL